MTDKKNTYVCSNCHKAKQWKNNKWTYYSGCPNSPRCLNSHCWIIIKENNCKK